MNWEKHKLGSLAKVISGFAFKSKDFKSNGDIPVIKIKDIQKERVVISEEYFLDKSFLQIDKKFHCQKGDILISLTGSHITLPNSVVGRIAKYQYDKTSLLNQRAGKIIVLKENVLDNDFLYYYLCQEEIRTELALFGRGGANQVNISPKNVESIDVTTPPIEIQKRIAEILSAYDNLIENNLKRIKLLEQAAQNIYKEWFENMRFPGYEEAKFDSETGLPEGWEIKELNSLIELLGGFAFKSKSYVDGGKYKIITIKNVGDRVFETSSMNHIDFIPSKLKKHCIIKEGDILLSLTGNVGRTCIAFGQDNLLNQRVAIIKPIKRHWRSYVYWLFNQRGVISMMNNLATGSAQQNLSPVKLIKEDILVPPAFIIEAYCEVAENHFNQIILLNKLNLRLKKARDILLPRLMNQTIEV